ncbi:Iron-sulfur cluster-binding protein [Candidatus Competibacter denitrificans Run_A_D11]|uniref:Iron-sulfur cluster-binding protein n=1 Tax=Candidatus Competibacter denitrificans Run_A_D11 TaxID=1400863 RepID=W6M6C3_9GAMM|nr:cytochrome c oxidase accessory protein CcoG [Candidatus Competibacter denitrificans]CDI01285.1 Iron-sulfur cluster-binding protein [Candidatus Competibacter denitrificans Run_A_D11]HRC68253.1 cytochrome c oxidase accessory protein CcoG [Candidatus Competibacter denitrificans]
MSEETAPLYQKRIQIYPRSVKGRFRNLKTGMLVLAYLIYYLLPWLRWERLNAPDQAVLYDLPGRHFYIFGLTIQVQDIFWLAGALIIFAILLFFVTGLAGRVWCGYFCFQTLWTDLFIMIEHWLQGERPARMRLDKGPWNREKIIKKGGTYAVWLLVAFWTGLTFTMYWTDAPTLVVDTLLGRAPYPAYFTTLFLTATTFVMAGLAREQVCTYMCPYARFQSAMFDHDTLIVSYDTARGEGARGRAHLGKGLKLREERQAQGVGDCIECGYCVQVCPVGIDIRKGLQYQCISCALCIDACDTIMDNLHWPRGLVGYTSENALNGRKTTLLKPKTVGYGVILTAAVGILTWSISTRALYTATVEQIRQPLYSQLTDGSIRNTYEIKLNNKLTAPLTMGIGIEGTSSAILDMEGMERIELEPQGRIKLVARVQVPPDPTGVDEEIDSITFVIQPVAGVTADPIRREVPFSRPETD